MSGEAKDRLRVCGCVSMLMVRFQQQYAGGQRYNTPEINSSHRILPLGTSPRHFQSSEIHMPSPFLHCVPENHLDDHIMHLTFCQVSSTFDIFHGLVGLILYKNHSSRCRWGALFTARPRLVGVGEATTAVAMSVVIVLEQCANASGGHSFVPVPLPFDR